MTDQEIFDKVATHLLTQGKRAGHLMDDGEFRCMYRGPEGTTCAIGCLIPDDLYSRNMENNNIHALQDKFPEIANFFEMNSNITRVFFLNSLQRAHDNYFEDPGTLKTRLARVAVEYGLNTDVLND